MADEDIKDGVEAKEEVSADAAGGKATDSESAPADADVEAQGRWVRYRCWDCGARNRVPSHWDWFECWNCGAINLT